MMHFYNEENEKGEQSEHEMHIQQQVERFDRLQFVFETNLDIVEIFKQREPQLYRDAVAFLKLKAVTDNLQILSTDANPVKQEWREALLESSSNQLKRLYRGTSLRYSLACRGRWMRKNSRK